MGECWRHCDECKQKLKWNKVIRFFYRGPRGIFEGMNSLLPRTNNNNRNCEIRSRRNLEAEMSLRGNEIPTLESWFARLDRLPSITSWQMHLGGTTAHQVGMRLRAAFGHRGWSILFRANSWLTLINGICPNLHSLENCFLYIRKVKHHLILQNSQNSIFYSSQIMS